MSTFYLPRNASKARLREAEKARQNRAEILKAYSHGQVSRRELIKWGIITTGGLLAPISGLSPFVAHAKSGGSGSGGSSGSSNIPTGMPPSPLFGVQAFSTPMPRFDVVPRNPVSSLDPVPQAQANTTQQPLNSALVGGQSGLTGPIEGRPPGAIWAHQRFSQFPPKVAIEMSQAGATANTSYNPQVSSSLNSGIDPTQGMPLKFHPGLPTQDKNSVWT